MNTETPKNTNMKHEHVTVQKPSSLPSLAQSTSSGVGARQSDGTSGMFTIKDSAKCEPCKTVLEGPLKSPLWVIQQIELDQNWWRKGGFLIVCGLVFHTLYGLATGAFGGWDGALMTALKAPLIALCSLGLCLPSLYIVSCIGGLRITLSQTFALASCVLAVVGLLLLGLTPVAWLFSASTNIGLNFGSKLISFNCKALLEISLNKSPDIGIG